VSDWSALNTYTWTPAVAGNNYRVSVWARSGGSTDIYEATNEGFFAIAGTAVSQAATITVPATVQGGATFQVGVANGPARIADWVGFFPENAADSGYLKWSYLNGSVTAPPALASSSATLTMTAPMTPGTYNVRLFEAGELVRRGTSTTITVTAPVVNATVSGSNINVTIQNPPGHQADWVGVFPANEGSNTGYVAWRYLNGLMTLPASQVASPSFSIPAPTAGGNYVVRLFYAGGLSLRASSATFAVNTTNVGVNTTTVSPGGTVVATIANGPAQVGDWAGVYAVGASPAQYGSWKYLNDALSRPATGIANATISLTMPLTPGTYEIRFFSNDSFNLVGTSVQITVAP